MRRIIFILTLFILTSCSRVVSEGDLWIHEKSSYDNPFDGDTRSIVKIIEIKDNWVRFQSIHNDVIAENETRYFYRTYDFHKQGEEIKTNPIEDETPVKKEEKIIEEESDEIEIL